MDARCLARRLAVWSLAASTLISQQAIAQQGSAAGSPAAAATASAESISRWTSRQRSFEIPFQLAENDTTTVVELYYSFSGESWQLYERRRGNDGKFVFQAERDGAYWFTSRTIDAQNRASPSGPLSAELLVIVDATEPQVEFNLVADEQGAVQCSWRIEDPGLAPQTLKLEYEVDGTWQPIAVQLPPQQLQTGTTSIRGGVTWQAEKNIAQANVRLSILDAAGNLAQGVKVVTFKPEAPAPSPSATAAKEAAAARDSVPTPTGGMASRTATPPTAAVPWQTPASTAASAAGSAEEVAASPYYRREPSQQSERLPAPAGTPMALPATTASDASRAKAYELPAPKSTAGNANTAGGNQPRGAAVAASAGATPWNTQQKPAAEQSVYGSRKQTPSATTSPVAGPIAPAVTRRASQNSEIAELLFGDLSVESTNTTTFQLDYDIEAVGPEGVAKIELWVTRNRGKDWVQYGSDPDFQSPFDVEVSEEGLYGFRVQVTGKNGLGAEPPKSGDQADIWVNIDTTKPVVELSNVPYGQGPTAGKLEIYWTAEDQSLAPRPVTLRYAEQPSGPWTTIAASIPNDGKYLWAIEANTPKEVYLRLEVTDKAGNVGVTQLADPVRLQPLIPKARIRGFTPVGRVNFEARQQTALVR